MFRTSWDRWRLSMDWWFYMWLYGICFGTRCIMLWLSIPTQQGPRKTRPRRTLPVLLQQRLVRSSEHLALAHVGVKYMYVDDFYPASRSRWPDDCCTWWSGGSGNETRYPQVDPVFDERDVSNHSVFTNFSRTTVTGWWYYIIPRNKLRPWHMTPITASGSVSCLITKHFHFGAALNKCAISKPYKLPLPPPQSRSY